MDGVITYGKTIAFLAGFAAVLLLAPTPAYAAEPMFTDTFATKVHPADQPPLSIVDLKDIPGGQPLKKEMGLPLDIRKDALREAAMSLGARGGLAYRTFQIRQDLKQYESYLDRVFDFRQLLIPAPSGLMIEPPIVSETDDALIIEPAGLKAAVADRILNINQNARIVTAPRTWRTYLERSWGSVELPPDILRPKTDEERAEWRRTIDKAWADGIVQADETFANDLNRLMADFNGMVRYRKLLAQGMISAPFALQTDRGVTGGGKDDMGRAQAMRVGDRAIQMTGVPEFVTGAQVWQPANQ